MSTKEEEESPVEISQLVPQSLGEALVTRQQQEKTQKNFDGYLHR